MRFSVLIFIMALGCFAPSAYSSARAVNETALAQTISLSLADSLTQSAPAASSPAVSRLREMRFAAESGKDEECVTLALKAKKSAKSLEPWILTLELECAARLPIQRANGVRLEKILNSVEAKVAFAAVGPWAPRLRSAWANAELVAIESDMKFNRTRAWLHIEKLSSRIASGSGTASPLDEVGRAKLWRLAGELMFLVQKNDGAREFFQRSLAEKDQPDLRERLRVLLAGTTSETSVVGAEAGTVAGPLSLPPLAPTAKQPDGSIAEIELADRISNSLKTGDLVAASEDAVKLIREFPGSTRAKWAADRIQDSLISVLERSNEKFQPVRDAILKAMLKSDADRQAEWARVLFNRGHWSESARLGRSAAEQQTPGRATKTLEIALDASYAIDDFKAVKALADELIEKHAGTASARTAALRSGLMSYRLKDYARSAAIFEKLIATPSTETLELQARYWLWRSLEKMQSERAKVEGEELAMRFPFSYYGLRARLEAGKGFIDWSRENPKLEKVQTKFWVTREEKLGFDRGLILVSAGWFDEAQLELAILPTPVTPEAKAVRAKVWAAAKNFLLASKLANEAWDAKFELRRPELMRAVWPNEHREFFEVQARAKNLDPWLLRSLAKQESGFNRKAVSSSNALGLMQMIPPTAREIAEDLKLGQLNLPDDMFEPERNIKMGTYYVGKMLNKFKGHIPLALAAYNNGPTRIERWLKSRQSLAGLETSRSSLPEFELWIDEFPFSETSFYVKAILRNQMLFQMVETGKLAAEEPLWKAASTVSRR